MMPIGEIAPPQADAGPTAQTRSYARAILLTALLLRLGVVWMIAARYPRNWFFTRGIELGLLAQSLATGHGFSSPFGGSTGATAYLAPGYPLLIALIFRVFGSYTVGAGIAIMLLQTAFSVATVAAMMHVARELFGNATALVAGAIWAVSLPLLWMPTIFWETSLSTLLLTSALALALRCRRQPTLINWALLGAFCAVSVLINPALLLALLGVAAWAAYASRRIAKPVYAPALGLLVFIVVLAPWPIRNFERLHAFIPLRSNFGFELWNGNRPGTDGMFDESLHPYYSQKELALYVSQGEVGYMREKSAIAKQSIRDHFGEFAGVSVRRVLRFWTGTAQAGGRSSWLIVFCTSAISLLGLVGLVALWKRDRAIALLFALPLLLFPAPYYVTHPDVRFRLVVDPLLTILTGYALTRLIADSADPEHD